MKLGSVALAALVIVQPAVAQSPPELPIKADKPYLHEPSGLSIPTSLDGLPRARANAFAAEHLDEDFNYFAAPDGDEITVFVFRNVTGSASVWFDRVKAAVESRDIYAGVTPVLRPTAFTPPGQSTASGLIATWRPGKSRYRSTGLAFMPLGSDWYVEIRYSSVAIAPEAMEAHLRAAVQGLGWPGRIAAQPAAAPVADCTTPLQLSGRASRIAAGQDASAMALLGALASAAAGDKSARKDKAAPTPLAWCRNVNGYGLPAQHGVYRPVGSTDSYFIAYNDAGRGVWVGPNTLGAIVAKEQGKSRSTWSVSTVDVAATTNFAERDRLPPPDQAYEIVRSEPYASRTTTWGKKRNIQLNSDLFK